MKGDLPAAAVRLLAILPVRQYRRPEKVPDVSHGMGPKTARPCIVKGRRYDTVYEAALSMKTYPNKIRKMIANGKARYE